MCVLSSDALRRLLVFVCLLCCLNVQAQQVVSLAGEWDFSVGNQPDYTDKIVLPGSMLTNGKGDIVTAKTQWTGSLYDSSFYFNPYMEKYRHDGAMKFPFFLTPDRHYTGNAWYRKRVSVPAAWKKRRVTLYLERPHIETTVFVNGREAGHCMSLSVPHEYDLTPYILFGKENEIAIKVYNGIENVCVGQDSHSVTDQTQGNWNGIVGRIELQARPKAAVSRVRIFPDVEKQTIRVELKRSGKGKTHLWVEGRSDMVTTSDSMVVIPMQGAQQWDEFSPHMYTLVAVQNGDTVRTPFGMRQIHIEGRQFYLNHRPVWMRGTVENCCFPETGYPPTDVESWRAVFRKCKEYGLNHMRFHSYCPPEAAFVAADELGFYLQPEGPSWPNHGVRLRRKMAIDRYLLDESKRIVDEYGHHPSFVMMAAGNEPAGDWVSYCNEWVKTMKAYDSSKVYCGASVGGGWAWDGGSEYHVKGGARGLEWDRRQPSSDDDYYSGIEFPRNYKGNSPNNTPIIAHEQGQWCAFPDLKERSQYTGVYKAKNFDIFSDLLRDHGMASQAEKFLHASGKLQTLCYKYEMERNLRTKDYAGFQLLALNDYSGQGTALEGVLNVHWREKGYCTAADWTQFCNAVVPLARFPKFVFTDTDFEIPVDVYNAYREPLHNARVSWTLKGSGANGAATQPMMLALGKNSSVAVVRPLAGGRPVTEPRQFTLIVTVTSDNAPAFSNSWDFWCYPKQLDMPAAAGIYIADTLDAKAVSTLRKGGKVLLLAAGRVTLGSDVRQTYLPVFWNTSWFKMRPPHTTGAYIDTAHPLFSHGFPTDNWSNLNWWELLNRAQVMNLMELPADYQSPVQPIDTWHVSRKLGMLVEANVMGGKLLMTTMDLSSSLEQRVVARQMRYALLHYMQSDDFNPSLSLDLETVGHFFTKQAPPVNMFTNDSPDELKPALK